MKKKKPARPPAPREPLPKIPCGYFDCGKIFEPTRRWQKYCSPDCKSDANRIGRVDPAGLETLLASARINIEGESELFRLAEGAGAGSKKEITEAVHAAWAKIKNTIIGELKKQKGAQHEQNG